MTRFNPLISADFKNIFFFFALVTVMLYMPAPTRAGDRWSVSTSLQSVNGNYMFESKSTSYYIYGGLKYQSSRWSASLTMPAIFRRDELVTLSGNMYLPTGQMHRLQDNGNGSWHLHGKTMMDSSQPMNFEMGLGDIYFRSDFLLRCEDSDRPAVSVNLQVKFPTADFQHGFGTGGLDYGMGLNFRKTSRLAILFLDIGYLVIGDPAGVEFIDPITFGAGVSKTVGHGKHSVMLYFQSYSEILRGYKSPRQLSLGYSYLVSRKLTFSFIALAGLSETSPDFGLLFGSQYALN